jgi:hypothetical protein
MQGPSWIALIRRIPASQHDCLIVMTTTGAEVVIQKVIRLDRDFLVCLARLSGSTEQGKLMVIPYDQLTYLSFNKKMTDQEIEAVVGKPGVAVQLVETAPEAVSEAVQEGLTEPLTFPTGAASEPGAVTPQPVQQVDPTAAPAKPGPKAAPPSKTMLLARLRQRLANDMAKQPSGD